ncbi:hypothetical protein AVEN_71794-1 [Araneus ventricosus]|uniref:Uncharacterized protein n=1 Tax=Araneus ventricosus TaxID=182803 RepID=A0A4Y1ZSV0_ARAVE|nr:hypothetical protein AVEN_71794-1 [Araneus ventricosus]
MGPKKVSGKVSAQKKMMSIELKREIIEKMSKLLTESSYLRKESELHGPRTELEYWKCRRDSFGFLVYQFSQEQNKLILQKPLESNPELQTVSEN